MKSDLKTLWVLLVLSLPVTILASPVQPNADGAQAQSVDSGVVATVNGQPIYYEDLERRLSEMHSGMSEAEREDMNLDRLLFRLVNDELLAQEAKAMGLQNEAPVPSKVESYREKVAVARLEREEIASKIDVSAEEIRKAFARDYRAATFRMATSYESEDAEEIHAELLEGADFATVAKERSIDQYSARGGLVENVARIDIPRAIAEVLFDSESADLIGPIETRLGWATLRVESITDADSSRFDELEGHIRRYLASRQADSLRKSLNERLRKTHPVEIQEALVDGIECEQLPDGRLMPQIEDREVVVAKIGDRTITALDYGRALRKRWKGVRNRNAAVAAKPMVLEGLIRRERLLLEAIRRGYGDTPEAKRAARAYEKELIVKQYLDEVVRSTVEVTEEDLDDFYKENRTLYPKPPKFHVGQITVSTIEEAERMIELLNQGTDLAWLARRHSIDRFKESGGDRGWIIAIEGGDPIQDALVDSADGAVVGPLGAPGNFIVLKVYAREEQGYYSREELSATARRAVSQRKFVESIDTYIKRLRDRAEIEVNEDVVARLQISGAPQGGDGESHGSEGH